MRGSIRQCLNNILVALEMQFGMPEVVAGIVELWYIGIKDNSLGEVVHLSLNDSSFRDFDFFSCQGTYNGCVLC